MKYSHPFISQFLKSDQQLAITFEAERIHFLFLLIATSVTQSQWPYSKAKCNYNTWGEKKKRTYYFYYNKTNYLYHKSILKSVRKFLSRLPEGSSRKKCYEFHTSLQIPENQWLLPSLVSRLIAEALRRMTATQLPWV